jgi:hypothetical protein
VSLVSIPDQWKVCNGMRPLYRFISLYRILLGIVMGFQWTVFSRKCCEIVGRTAEVYISSDSYPLVITGYCMIGISVLATAKLSLQAE